MLRRTAVVGLMSLCILSALAAPGYSAEPKDLKIGIICTLSGPGVSWGLAVKRGAELAIDEVNQAGGLKVGNDVYKITTIAYDDQFSGKGGVAAANRLVFEDKVKFIIGTNSAASVIAAQEVTEPNHVIVMTDGYGAKVLSPNKPYTFRVTPTTTEFAIPMTAWVAKNHPNAKTVAVVSPNDEAGWDIQQIVIKGYEAAGVKVIHHDFYERGTKDFFPLLTRALGTRPDILDIDGSNPGEAGVLIRQARQLGFKGLIVKTGGPGVEEIVRVAGTGAAEGFVFYSPVSLEDPAYKKFLDTYEAKYGTREADPLTPLFYDGTKLLLSAMKKAGTLDVEAVKKTLEGIKEFQGLFGKNVLTGKDVYGIAHQVDAPFYIGRIINGQPTTVAKIEVAK
ncbi:MAG: ABC transporter substrate-binding protein [Bacteroidota bacterium]